MTTTNSTRYLFNTQIQYKVEKKTAFHRTADVISSSLGKFYNQIRCLSLRRNGKQVLPSHPYVLINSNAISGAQLENYYPTNCHNRPLQILGTSERSYSSAFLWALTQTTFMMRLIPKKSAVSRRNNLNITDIFLDKSDQAS